MSLQQEFIPELEMPLISAVGEQAVLAWDTTALQAQLGITISSVAWSVEDAAILSLGTPSSSGDDFMVPVTAVAKGCSHVYANVTTSDVDQNPTFLIIKVNVITPVCGGI